jgi:hypothetical protein
VTPVEIAHYRKSGWAKLENFVQPRMMQHLSSSYQPRNYRSMPEFHHASQLAAGSFEGMAFWIALTDMEPDMGTMSFVNSSHRLGVLAIIETAICSNYSVVLERCIFADPMTYKNGRCDDSLGLNGAWRRF